MHAPLLDKTFILSAVLFFGLHITSASASAQTYTIKDLGTLGGSYAQAHGINASGQITGASSLANNTTGHSFLYTAGTLKDIGSLGGTNSVGLAINKSGQIAGYSTLSNGSYRGFIYANGTMTALPTLGGNYSAAYGSTPREQSWASPRRAITWPQVLFTPMERSPI